MRRTVRLSSVRSLVSAVLVSLTFIFQSEDFSHFGGRMDRLRPGADALRNVHRKRGILRVFEAAFDHLARRERFAAAGLRDQHVEPVLGVGRRSNRGRHVMLSIREWPLGRFGDRFDPSTPFDLSTPFDRLRDRAQDTAGSGHRKLNGLSSGTSKWVRPCRVPPVRRFSPYRALIAAAPPPTAPSIARARPRSRPPRPPVAPAVPRGRRGRLPRCAGS